MSQQKKQSDATLPATPGTPQPATSTSTNSKTPQLPLKTSKEASPQQPTSLIPTKETIHPETKPAQTSIPLEERHDEPTDKEIEELLQPIDAPTITKP